MAAAPLVALPPHCRWTSPRISNPASAPEPRHGHAAAYADANVWVFGGVNANGAFLGDLHRLSLDDGAYTWHAVPTAPKTQPTPRAGAILIPLGRNTGAVPLSLLAASLPITGVNKLLLFGGVTSTGASSDLFVLDLAASRPAWHRVIASGPQVPPRHHAQARVVCQQDGSLPRLIVSGGEVNDQRVGSTMILDLATWTWSQGDTHPAPGVILSRSRGSAVSQGGCMISLGGETGAGKDVVSNEALVFHTTDHATPAIEVTRATPHSARAPQPRAFSTVTTIRSDGAVLHEEHQPNALGLGVSQPHNGAQFLNRMASQSTIDIYVGLPEDVASAHDAGAPGEGGGPGAAAGVTQSNYLIGGCASLSGESRFADLWRIVFDEDLARIAYEKVEATGVPPVARADHVAVAIPLSGRVSQQEGETSATTTSDETSSVAPLSNTPCVGRILVFGGSLAPGRCANDVHVLEVHAAPMPDFDDDAAQAVIDDAREDQNNIKPANATCCVLQ